MLMDELGFMENEAELFQEAVIETLKSGVPVLGVVKKKSSPFLDRVRALAGVRIIEVTEENRDSLAAAVERRSPARWRISGGKASDTIKMCKS